MSQTEAEALKEELASVVQFSADSIDFDLYESAVSAVVVDRLEDRRWRNRAVLRRYERNGPLRRLVTARLVRRYSEERPDAELGDIQSFMEWLIANWDSILQMIMSIIQLFSV